MAQVLHGLLKGRVGDRIYSIRNGKQFVSAVSDRKKAEPTPGQLQRQFIFSVSTALAHAVLKNRIIGQAWKRSKIKASGSCHKFVKKNYRCISGDGNVSRASLTENHFLSSPGLTGSSYKDDKFTCTFKIPFIPPDAKSISMQGAVQLIKSLEPCLKDFMFVHLRSDETSFTPGTDVTLVSVLSPQESELIKNYSEMNILVNLAFYDAGMKLIGFSRTVFDRVAG